MKTDFTRRKIIGTLLASGFLQACGGGGNASPVTKEGEESGAEHNSPATPSGPTLTALSTQVMYIAHRGSAALYPEETMLAYDKSIEDKQLLIECDVQTLADGALVLMHDKTVDDVSTASGAVARYTEKEWRELKIDGSRWHGSNYGDLSAALFSEWVSRYNGKTILIPEDKDLKSMTGIVATLKASNVNKDQALLQSFSLDSLRPAVAAGYPACFLTTAISGLVSAKNAGVKYVGLRSDATLAEVQSWTANGIRVLMWTVNRRYQRDLSIPFGVNGFFSDDPVYLSATAPLWLQDRFELQTWLPGMLGSTEESGLTGRGKFLGDGFWGYSQVGYAYSGCLQGYLCPIKGQLKPENFTLSFSIRFDGVLNNDETRWASVFLGLDDHPFIDKNEATAGHHLVFRKNGSIEIYKKSLGTAAVKLAGIGGNPIHDGEEVRFQISVSENEIAVARLNEDNSESSKVISKDLSPRGPYVQLGRSGLACGFRKVVVT